MIRSSRLRSIVIAALLALAATAVPGAAYAASATDVSWTVRTESNQFGVDRTGFDYALDPGASISDGLVVGNGGPEPLTLAVYAADGFTTDTGQLDVLKSDGSSVALGVWVHADTTSVVVPAGGSVTIPFTLTVPADATPGDYAGGLVTSLQSDAASGISVDRRLGIRVSLRVGGALAPAMGVEGATVDWAGGFLGLPAPSTVTYTLRNTGNTALAARQEASVAGPFGWFSAPAGALDDIPELLPGESRTVTATVPTVAPLVWLLGTATVTPIAVDASGSSSLMIPVVVTATGWAVPWALLVLLVLIAAAIVGGVLLRRRRRAIAQAREDERVAAAVAAALGTAAVAPAGTAEAVDAAGPADGAEVAGAAKPADRVEV
ncbi:WxL protein peptidoglycan domain-containing protein [Microbacterium sp. CJ88]|uniref:WxL protein peptidoglycan domain-containing protein n=1 Tax=Microbacterium sp. CJ88 TaxID=3445672 RepID=UPI003F656340